MASPTILTAIRNWELSRSLIASNERYLAPRKLFVPNSLKRHDCREGYHDRCKICAYRKCNAEISRLKEQYP